jgi:protein-arginine kinase
MKLILTKKRIKLYERAIVLGVPEIVISMYGNSIQKLLDDEREACAALVDENAMACDNPIYRSLLQANAEEIRAREGDKHD